MKVRIQKEERDSSSSNCPNAIEENEVIKKNIMSTCVLTVSDLHDESIVIREKKSTSIDMEIWRYGDNLSALIENIPANEEKDNKFNQLVLDRKDFLEKISKKRF